MDVNQIWKINIFSKRFLYKFLGGRSITETTGIILMCFDGKYYLSLQKNAKNLKSAYELIASRAACWAALL